MAGGEPLPPRKRPAPSADSPARKREKPAAGLPAAAAGDATPPPRSSPTAKDEAVKAEAAAAIAVAKPAESGVAVADKAATKAPGEELVGAGEAPEKKCEPSAVGAADVANASALDELVRMAEADAAIATEATDPAKAARAAAQAARAAALAAKAAADEAAAYASKTDVGAGAMRKAGGTVHMPIDDSETPVSQASGMLVREFVELIGNLRGALRELVPRAPPLVSPPEPGVGTGLGAGGGGAGTGAGSSLFQHAGDVAIGTGSAVPRHWGNLLSQHYLVPHVQLDRKLVILGRGPKVNVQLSDPSLSMFVVRLTYGGRGALVEALGSTNVLLNGRLMDKNQRYAVRSGDEIGFQGMKTRYSYVLQMLKQDSASSPSNKSPAPCPSTPVKTTVVEAFEKRPRSKFASAAAVASTLTPASTVLPQVVCADDAVAPADAASPSAAGKEPTEAGVATAMDSEPASEARRSDAAVPVSAEAKLKASAEDAPSTSVNAEPTAGSVQAKGTVDSRKEKNVTTSNPLSSSTVDASAKLTTKAQEDGKSVTFGDVTVVPLADGKKSAESQKTTPDSAKPGLDLSCAVGAAKNRTQKRAKPCSTHDASPEVRRLRSEARTRAVEEAAVSFYERHVVRADDLDVSFEKFPYSYLSEDLRKFLVAWAYGHLLHPDVTSRLKLPTLASPRMLLSGANGTELYLENIVRALARHFKADLLVMDMADLSSLAWELRPPALNDGRDHAALNAELDKKLGISDSESRDPKKLDTNGGTGAGTNEVATSASAGQDDEKGTKRTPKAAASEAEVIESGAEAMVISNVDASGGAGHDGADDAGSVTRTAESSPMNDCEDNGMNVDKGDVAAAVAAAMAAAAGKSLNKDPGAGAKDISKDGSVADGAIKVSDGGGQDDVREAAESAGTEGDVVEEVAGPETALNVAMDTDGVATLERSRPQSTLGRKTSQATGATVFKFGDRVVYRGRSLGPAGQPISRFDSGAFEDALKSGLLRRTRMIGGGRSGQRTLPPFNPRSLSGDDTSMAPPRLSRARKTAFSKEYAAKWRGVPVRPPPSSGMLAPKGAGGVSAHEKAARRMTTAPSVLFGGPMSDPKARDPRDKPFSFPPRDKIQKPRSSRRHQGPSGSLFRQAPGPTEESGPKVGALGNVVLTFDDDSKRVGVRFDDAIPGGSNLGNVCEHTHGFFCRTDELMLDGLLDEKVLVEAEVPPLAEALFAHISKKQKEKSASPVIVFIPDAVRVLYNMDNSLGDPPGDVNLGIELEGVAEKLGDRVVLLGTSVPADIRAYSSSSGSVPAIPSKGSVEPYAPVRDLYQSESPASVIFGSGRDADKGGMGSMPGIHHFLVRHSQNSDNDDGRWGRPNGSGMSGAPSSTGLDSNLIDHLVRMEDRLDRMTDAGLKGGAAPSRVFLTRLPVETPPIDSLLHVSFKKELEADAKRLKLEVNLKSFGSSLKRLRLRCERLAAVRALSQRLFSDKEISNALGLAVGAQLMDDDKKGKKQIITDETPTPSSASPSAEGPDSSPSKSPETANDDTDHSLTMGEGENMADDSRLASRPASDGNGGVTIDLVVPVDGSADFASNINLAVAQAFQALADAPQAELFGDGGGSLGAAAGKVMEGIKYSPKKVESLKEPILELLPASISKGINMARIAAGREVGTGTGETKAWTSKSLKNVTADNEFERKLLSEGVVVPADEVGVKFDDIGALDSVKEVLQEVVMLPLRRPGLFKKGNLAVPVKGVLLFGLPGTGKTLSAKAVATEAGANFINITMSSIASKWFGEGEKYVRAVFTLARKLSPAVIFVDEVDSMLGRRERPGEHEAMRKIKNEFMLQWDGLRSSDADRVLVLGSTNRPFDLDDAVLRRFPRRLMVDLPDASSRAGILKKITEKEDLAPSVDLAALAETLEGYSGSDLRNLCVSAAMEPVRDILAAERAANDGEVRLCGPKAEGKKPVDGDATDEDDEEDEKDAEEEETVRALEMRDFEKAASSMSASVSEDAPSVAELRKWNATYGENGSRKKEPLAYFM